MRTSPASSAVVTIACMVVTLWCDSADAATESNHRACDAIELTPGIRFEPRNASFVVTLDNGRTVTLVPSIKRSATVDEAFTGPGDLRQKPTFDQYPDCQVLTATYALPKDRTFRVQIRKYPGTTGVTVASELISDSNRAVTEYFYWSWSNPAIELTVGGEDLKPQTLRLDPNKYNPIGSVNWAYGDWGTDGLLVVPRGFNLGTTDNNAANCYLTAIPPERLLGQGDALSVVFGLARAPETDAAPKIAAGLLERLGGARQKPAAQKTIAYGRPAPQWYRDLRVGGTWNGHRASWTEEMFEKVKPFRGGMVHVVCSDEKILQRLHDMGIKALHYVLYNGLMDFNIWHEKKGTQEFGERTESVGYKELLDLSMHPDWICIDSKGTVVGWPNSGFGVANNLPGWIDVCFHQQSLHEAAIKHVEKIMEMGYDGIFVDLAGPAPDCFGDRFGKHKHERPEKSNTEMHEELMQKIYRTVKKYGDDRIVIQNGAQFTHHYPYADSLMWEAMVYDYSGNKMQDNDTLLALGEECAQAAAHGKPVWGHGCVHAVEPATEYKQLTTYVYAQLFDMIWCGGLADNGNKMYMALNHLDLGRPLGERKRVDGVVLREFEKGIIAWNPSRSSVDIGNWKWLANDRYVRLSRKVLPGTTKGESPTTLEADRADVWVAK